MNEERIWLNGPIEYPASSLASIDPSIGNLLRSQNVPRRFFRYFTSDGSTSICGDRPEGQIVRFGLTRSNEYICLSSADLSVLQVSTDDFSEVSVVNSSLDKFLEFMALCEARYPYYTDEDDIEVSIEVSIALEGTMSRIDPVALEPDSYWSNFLSDVANGDYSVSEDEDE